MERHTLPGPDYHDPAIFEREREQVFFRSWFLAGLAEEAPTPGSWFTVDVVGESILVMRGNDGLLRGFYNVCRHRGSRLREEVKGEEQGALACPYHAWCYSFTGDLISTPRVGADEIDRSQHGLHPVHVDVWQGLVYVNLDESPLPLLDWLQENNSDLLDLGRFEMGELRMVDATEFLVEANWKIVIENYCECLHCPTVHPELVEVIPAYKTGWVYEEGRTDGGVTARSRNYGPADAGDILLMPTVPEEDATGIYGAMVFPNSFVDVGGTGVVVSQLIPISSTQTRVRSLYLFHPRSIQAPGFDPSGVVAFSNLVTAQDNAVCERAQRGVRSRSFVGGGVYPEKDEYVWDFNQRYLAARDGTPKVV